MTPRRLTVGMLLTALAMGAVPADAAPRAYRVTDGFTFSGKAGSRVRIRVTGPLDLSPRTTSRHRGLQVAAKAGPIAGFALVGTDGDPAVAYAVGTTPVWACGAASCPGHGVYVFVPNATDSDVPKGEYTLVLVGAPGAYVTVTVHPADPKRRPTPLRATGSSTPIVAETTGVGTGLQVDPVASGTFTAAAGRPGVAGIVHAVDLLAGAAADSELAAGRGPSGSCAGTSFGHTTLRHDPAEPTHETKAAVAYVTSGSPCGTWQGTLAGAGRQRGVGFFVPTA